MSAPLFAVFPFLGCADCGTLIEIGAVLCGTCLLRPAAAGDDSGLPAFTPKQSGALPLPFDWAPDPAFLRGVRR